MEGTKKGGGGHIYWGLGLLVAVGLTVWATRSYDKNNVAGLIPTGTSVAGTAKA